MSLSVSSSSSSSSSSDNDEDPPPGEIDIHLPPEIDWHMLDKSRFFLLGAALFSGVSASLYPAVVLKTRIQVSPTPISCFRTAASILRLEGPQGFYRGFATSLAGTVPARALYMAALELTKTTAAAASARLGLAADTSAAVAAASNAVAGLSAAVAAQIVWTPVDVVSQRLMVQQQQQQQGGSPPRYRGGLDAFRQIVVSDGIRGLYRGFGMSVLTYAPSNAVWWASYSLSQRVVWRAVRRRSDSGEEGVGLKPDCGAVAVAVVQGMSAAMAGGAAALVTMPLDTIKTRMQVMDGCEEEEGRMTIGRAVKSLRKEGGWMACYRGLGPRWASMSLSATTMITTYEFLKRLSAKDQGSCG